MAHEKAIYVSMVGLFLYVTLFKKQNARKKRGGCVDASMDLLTRRKSLLVLSNDCLFDIVNRDT